MSLLQKLKDWYYDTPPTIDDELEEAEATSATEPVVHGGIVKTERPVFTPVTQRHGGRMVKTMPRQLRAIKEAQERVEDDA